MLISLHHQPTLESIQPPCPLLQVYVNQDSMLISLFWFTQMLLPSLGIRIPLHLTMPETFLQPNETSS